MLEERLFPREVTSDVPRITMVGGSRVQVEQHHGLSVYRPELILFRAAGSSIRITGSGLRFHRYTANDAVIEGAVDAVTVEKNTKGGVTG